MGEQKKKAAESLKETFLKPSKEEEKVLFYLPVTQSTIEQAALSLTLENHSSYQGTVQFFKNIFDYSMSRSSVGNIVEKASKKSLEINSHVDLSSIKIGAHD